MGNHSISYLRRKRKALIKKLAAIGPDILRGSLIERYKRCNKKGCKCMKGPGHGPKYYLSISFPHQQPEQDYIPQSYYKKTKQYLKNFKKVREILEQICKVNREIIKRRKNL